jgi:short subunit dehydrogenase-like uncharacterized protein
MAGRIVLFGATGYTGDLTARALVAEPKAVRPVLAGRDETRIRALAEELGDLDWAVADVAEPRTVRALIERGDVLVSTVGPFNRWGRPAVEAAIDAGAHYLDSTGEGRFIREVFDNYGPRAQAAGCGLLTAFGYDWVPGNLAGALALARAGKQGKQARRVRIGYFVTGRAMTPKSLSGGTRASAGGVMLDRGFAFRDGGLVSERPAKRVRRFEVKPGTRVQTLTVSSTEHLALPRVYPALTEVDVYLGWFGPASRALQGVSLAMAGITRLPGAKVGLDRLMAGLAKGSTGGPDAATRSRGRSLVLGEALDASGEVLDVVRLEGVNGYDFTGRILAWGARTAAEGGLQSAGALGPVDGFGLEALQAGCLEAGLEASLEADLELER